MILGGTNPRDSTAQGIGPIRAQAIGEAIIGPSRGPTNLTAQQSYLYAKPTLSPTRSPKASGHLKSPRTASFFFSYHSFSSFSGASIVRVVLRRLPVGRLFFLERDIRTAIIAVPFYVGSLPLAVFLSNIYFSCITSRYAIVVAFGLLL